MALYYIGFPLAYLLENVNRVPTALQPGGEAGGRGRIVVLCGLREELGHRNLVWHPLPTSHPPTERKKKGMD